MLSDIEGIRLFTILHLSANKLPLTGSPFSKSPSTFVEISLDGLSSSTKVVKNCTCPVWDDSSNIILKSTDPSSTLRIRVMCLNLFGHTTVWGTADVQIKEILGDRRTFDHTRNFTFDLASKKKDNNSSLSIQFLELTNTEAMSMGTTSSQNMLQSRGLGSDALGVGTFLESSNVTKALGSIISRMEVFAKIVEQSTKIHPYIFIAWSVTSALYKVVKAQLDRDHEIVKLVATLDDLFSFVLSIESFPSKIRQLEEVIIKILIQTVECVIFIREYTGHGFAGRVFRQTLSNCQNKIDEFSMAFRHLKESLTTGVLVSNALVSLRTYEKIDLISRTQTFERLKPLIQSSSFLREECLPGTRTGILEHIMGWAINPSKERNVLWLSGLAGAGKSTIATTIASRFRELGRLGAAIFFDRNTTSDPSMVIRTLAYQLGLFDQRIGAAIDVSIKTIPGICEASIDTQFDKFLKEPISKLANGPIIIIIDAVDECGTPKSRKGLLPVLANRLSELPSSFRVLVTSRVEFDIEKAFKCSPNLYYQEVDTTAVENKADISLYLTDQMRLIREENIYLDLAQDWPGEESIHALVQRSGGLFIWASTAAMFIFDGHDPTERLKVLLDRDVRVKAESALDDLYITALRSCGKWDDEAFTSDFRAIMGTALVSYRPLELPAIDYLSGLLPSGTRPAIHTVSRLRCVLRCEGKDGDGVVQVLHPSFADFLVDKSRCGDVAWFIDTELHRRNLTKQCFHTIIRELNTSLRPGQDFEQRVRAYSAAPHFVYAARWWSDHLLEFREEVDPEIIGLLDEVLNGRLEQLFGITSYRSEFFIMNAGILKRLKPWIDFFAPKLSAKNDILGILKPLLRAERRMSAIDTIQGLIGSSPDEQKWLGDVIAEFDMEQDRLLNGPKPGDTYCPPVQVLPEFTRRSEGALSYNFPWS